ncbi:carbamoyltransferase HypF [Thiohalobacter sp.]|uniref:carbamoyltransferase HypF n=1 Tax=Thiohalobacter sp. TaxID=2025948 RepID=UPI00261A9D38|nr:carbamoyltransferase HypF [Thiohalobacter sp.]
MTPGAEDWIIGGRVQGVGFRPFLYRVARELGLAGWVCNRLGDVELHLEGPADRLALFAQRLSERAPPLARPEIRERRSGRLHHLEDFEIRPSAGSAEPEIHVPPDFFACDDCLRELRDPADRRYRYPFNSCTQCGPRYTLIDALPWDRANTSMRSFALCADCAREYADPGSRRFHAEPVACPVCGPRLRFETPESRTDDNEAALAAALHILREGGIVAVKGIGGYHLLCDARDAATIGRLRSRKPRPDKPLAVLFPLPEDDAGGWLERCVVLDDAERRLLFDPQRPILLARRRADAPLPEDIAPGLAEIGVLLPYSPLHALLSAGFGAPLVATSGNLSGEPVITDPDAARRDLAGVADAFLHHDRPIARPADDSVWRTLGGRPRPLRLGRGAAPVELRLPRPLATPTLAVGAHMKATLALGWGRRAIVSPHIADLGSAGSQRLFEALIADLQRLYGVEATRVVHDAHPGYASTRWARDCGLPTQAVFHHAAHASALAAEYPDIAGRWLVFTWDGTGYGQDGTLWGGEALYGRPGHWERVFRLRPFRLPGGERAGREPWRSAAALCWETGREPHWQPEGAGLLRSAWQQGLNCPQSGAAGRLFDAAASLLGLTQVASHEGQGPMRLEALAQDCDDFPRLPLHRAADRLFELDWSPLLELLLDDGRSPAERAGAFHAALAQAIADAVELIAGERPVEAVGLTGGVFQNRRLVDLTLRSLRARDWTAHLPAQLPCNDAGISFGQLAELMPD